MTELKKLFHELVKLLTLELSSVRRPKADDQLSQVSALLSEETYAAAVSCPQGVLQNNKKQGLEVSMVIKSLADWGYSRLGEGMGSNRGQVSTLITFINLQDCSGVAIQIIKVMLPNHNS